MNTTHVSIGSAYSPGDPPPDGYTQWHEWAASQHRAGLRQRWCEGCGKWRFPQEKCCEGSPRITRRQLNALAKHYGTLARDGARRTLAEAERKGEGK